MGVSEIRAYLAPLVLDKNVAASTQNVALNVLLSLYRNVLQIDLPRIESVEWAKRPARIPAVFARAEGQAILSRLNGEHWLIASLLYGVGLHLVECKYPNASKE